MAQKELKRYRQGVSKKTRRKKRKEKQPPLNMSDAARLYRVILGHIQDRLPELMVEHQLTLAMLVTGMLRERSGQLKKIARGVQYDHKKESLAERFRRFVRNKHIQVEVEYAPFGQRIVQAVGAGPLVLLIDSSKMGGKCLCLMLSVYYKSRALPLAWVTFKGKKGHSSQQTQLALFEQVKALLPPELPVVLLGDGEFDGSEVIDWFNQQPTWQYVCRTDKSNKVFYQGQWQSLSQLPLQDGEETFLSQVRFTESNNVGPVNILVVWHEAKQEHWFFVTNLQTAAQAQAYYLWRFTIETLFSDLKDRGLHRSTEAHERLDDTRLWHPERLHRLIFAAAIAYFFTIVLGVEAIISRAFEQLVRTDAFYHSLFQLGLIYLDHLLNEYLDFPSLIDLPPPEAFEHVVLC
jgi:hypothetical protein